MPECKRMQQHLVKVGDVRMQLKQPQAALPAKQLAVAPQIVHHKRLLQRRASLLEP